MKNNIKLVISCCLIILTTLIFSDKISDFLANIVSQNLVTQKSNGNEYTKSYDYEFFDINKNQSPLSYNELIGSIYEAINNKETTYTFYCPSEYTDCIKDIEEISDNALLLTHLNNFVHPYNSFTNIKTIINESGEINLNITYLYSEDEINKINNKIDIIIQETINEDMDDYEKLKAIHDYIINNTKYDVKRNESGESNHESYKASGALLEGIATCNGYADALAIILSKLGYDNFKIATTPEEISYESTGHVWNAVKYEDNWVHIDLTWDDPVSKDNKDYLYHKYFLVNNEEMAEADSGEVKIEEHNYDKTIYVELNQQKNLIVNN